MAEKEIQKQQQIPSVAAEAVLVQSEAMPEGSETVQGNHFYFNILGLTNFLCQISHLFFQII